MRMGATVTGKQSSLVCKPTSYEEVRFTLYGTGVVTFSVSHMLFHWTGAASLTNRENAGSKLKVPRFPRVAL